MENTSENLEHIEHNKHAAHGDPLDRWVAVSMAIIAALLATVTLLSHRAHNATLRFQTEANIEQTKASDQWGYYQAVNIRKHEYEANLEMLTVIAKQSGTDEQQKRIIDDWKKQLDKYKTELPQLRIDAEAMVAKSRAAQTMSEQAHHEGDRFDLGELGVELGLVLCSLAILTKRKPFWFAGMTSALLGVIAAGSAFVIH
jgi:hypothetical protein